MTYSEFRQGVVLEHLFAVHACDQLVEADRSMDGWIGWMEPCQRARTKHVAARLVQVAMFGTHSRARTVPRLAFFFLTNNFVCATCHVARRRATRRVFCGSPRVPRRRVKVNRSVVLYVLFSLLAKRHVCIYKYTGGDDLSENDPAHPQKKKTTQLALVCRCSTYV